MLNYPRAGRRCAHRSSGRYLRPNAFAVSTRRSTSPVTFTVSAVAVGMSISRVTQHRVMSYSAGDGRELFRWPWNGRLSLIFSVLSTLRGGQKVTETVTYTRYLASGTCLTLCTHRQYTCGGGGHRKPHRKRRLYHFLMSKHARVRISIHHATLETTAPHAVDSPRGRNGVHAMLGSGVLAPRKPATLSGLPAYTSGLLD